MGGWSDAIQSQIESIGVGRASIRVVTASLSSLQLLASATPIQVLPSPGATKSYVVHNSSIRYRFGGTPYTITGLSGIRLFGDVFANAYWLLNGAAILALSVDTNAQGQLFSNNVSSTSIVNQPMFLSANVNPTIGNGSVTYTIYYSILDGSIQ